MGMDEMGHKLLRITVLLALAFPAAAAPTPGAISGYVKNSAGIPQMGAMVQFFTSPAAEALTVFTDAHGFYRAAGLPPGTYDVKVTAPTFLPSLRENVNLRAGASLLINVTLNTLFEAIQLLPRRAPLADEDDWKWTLRSAANRPILRVLDDGPLVVVSRSNRRDDRALKARVAFVAGNEAEGFGSSPDMSTRFTLERSLFSSGTLSLGGSVGYDGGPEGALRATYSHQMPDGSTPEVSLTVRRLATPDSAVRNAALQALALSLADSVTLADFIDLHFGSEFQTIQFMGRVSALRPFGSVDVHLSPNTVVEYQYATSEPNTRHLKGYDTAPADLSESGPHVSLAGPNAVLERARHQEISLSRRFGNTSVQVAAYAEHISNAAYTGAGDTFDGDDLLPDIYSNTFTYNAGNLDTNGLRLVVQHKFPAGLTATANYSYGGVLDLVGNDVNWSEVHECIRQERRHAVGGKLSGAVPRAHTRWIASYKWTSGRALNPVDAFNVSPGQMDPYLNVFIRQPIPGTNFLPGRMEALVDLRNLLAQGYVPVMGRDGRTLYLVQSARSVRGGVAFVF
jgi:hypothetical protein